MAARYDIPTLKQAAAARGWARVLADLAGTSDQIFDGQHHPCPKCGGIDRFRMIDRDAGACFCNKCFDKKNGDGIAALEWLTGQKIGEVLRQLGDYLGVKPCSGNGEATNHATKTPKIFATKMGLVRHVVASLAAKNKPGARPVKSWSYGDFEVVRFDWPALGNDKPAKEFRPMHPAPLGASGVTGWTLGYPGGPKKLRPLYRLADLRAYPSKDLVVIVGGEKCADAAAAIGLPATCNSGGEGAIEQTDWTPLAEYDTALIVLDNDEKGEAFGEKVAAKLKTHKASQKVKVIRLPGLPPKGDIVEWLAAGGNLQSFLRIHWDTAEWEPTAPNAPDFAHLVPLHEFLAMDYRHDFLVDDILAAGQPCVIGGRQKACKTTVALSLAVALGSGKPFLRRFNSKQSRVAIWSAETDGNTIQGKINAMLKADAIDPHDCLIFPNPELCLPKVGDESHLAALATVFEKNKIDVAFIDPLNQSLFAAGEQTRASDLYSMGPRLYRITELGKKTGTTIIVLHHFKKNSSPDKQEPCELEDLSQAGVGEWMRQWILLERQGPYKSDGLHSLFMRTGGSAGHSGFWGLDIDEGSKDDRKWEVEIKSLSDVKEEFRKEKERKRSQELERKEGEYVEKVLEAIRQYPEGCTEKKIRLHARLNPTNAEKGIFWLIRDGKIEQFDMEIGGRNRVAYRLK